MALRIGPTCGGRRTTRVGDRARSLLPRGVGVYESLRSRAGGSRPRQSRDALAPAGGREIFGKVRAGTWLLSGQECWSAVGGNLAQAPAASRQRFQAFGCQREAARITPRYDEEKLVLCPGASCALSIVLSTVCRDTCRDKPQARRHSTPETVDGAGGRFRSKLQAAASSGCSCRQEKLAPGHRESVAGTPREKLDKEQVGAGDEVVTSGQSAPCSPRCRPGGRHPTHLVSCNQYH